MFKLTVVGGPTKGQSFQVKDGEMTVGRVPGNDIILVSQKVSKKHCVLVVNNAEVTVKDAGSSNGTFVNGVLTKLKKLLPGDRVSVGEYVLELSKLEVARPRQAVAVALENNVVQLHGAGVPALGGFQGSGGTGLNMMPPGSVPMDASNSPNNAAPPQSLQEKVKFYFDTYILNFVYNLNEKHEWKAMMTGMFIALTASSALLSVYPVLERVSEKLASEAEGRAFMLSRQIVDRNAPFLYEKMDSKVDIGWVEKEPGVLSAYLIDMDGRILAPGRKLNQYITELNEASFSAAARNSFTNKENLERKSTVFGDAVAVATPLKIFSAASGKNITVALGIVFFDRTLIMFDQGTEALTYIQAIILSAIVAVIMFFALYRLTLRPLVALNEDIDQVLKGNAGFVNKRYKMEELNPLIDVVNSALQRATAAGNGAGGGSSDSISGDDVITLLKFSSNRSGLMLFSADKKILHVSPFMEEISGIRADSAVGGSIGDVARDAAFAAYVDDALARAPMVGQEPNAEDFEFSGTAYKLECMAVGSLGAVKVYVLAATKPS